MNPKISVVMSVHNGAAHLEDCILSILNQSLKDFELIIIDDLSTDKSINIIKKLKTMDKRIRSLNNKTHLGLTKSLNKGLRLARGKYIARIDADDIALPRRLEIQYEFMEKNKDVFLIGSNEILIDGSGRPIKIMKRITDEVALRKALPKGNQLSHPTIFFRNTPDARYRDKFYYAQDYDFILIQLSRNRRVLNLGQPLMKYRINPEGISFSKKAQQAIFAEVARKFYYQRLSSGKDGYYSFKKEDILRMDLSNSQDKMVLQSQIDCLWVNYEFKKVRKKIIKYLKLFGLFSKPEYICKFMLSLLGNKLNLLKSALNYIRTSKYIRKQNFEEQQFL